MTFFRWKLLLVKRWQKKRKRQKAIKCDIFCSRIKWMWGLFHNATTTTTTTTSTTSIKINDAWDNVAKQLNDATIWVDDFFHKRRLKVSTFSLRLLEAVLSMKFSHKFHNGGFYTYQFWLNYCYDLNQRCPTL